MNLERFELADVHAPDRLARKVHEQLGKCDGAVPVDEIALALDIVEVRRDALDGVEGVLLTDAARSAGAIFVNNTRGQRRARVSNAYELGHFLMEQHVLSNDVGFGCTPADMRERRVAVRHHKQETEANTFAIGLLAPTFKLAPTLADDPDLRSLRDLAASLDISMEALVPLSSTCR